MFSMLKSSNRNDRNFYVLCVKIHQWSVERRKKDVLQLAPCINKPFLCLQSRFSWHHVENQLNTNNKSVETFNMEREKKFFGFYFSSSQELWVSIEGNLFDLVAQGYRCEPSPKQSKRERAKSTILIRKIHARKHFSFIKLFPFGKPKKLFSLPRAQKF